jgi:hypothetical protein
LDGYCDGRSLGCVDAQSETCQRFVISKLIPSRDSPLCAREGEIGENGEKGRMWKMGGGREEKMKYDKKDIEKNIPMHLFHVREVEGAERDNRRWRIRKSD